MSGIWTTRAAVNRQRGYRKKVGPSGAGTRAPLLTSGKLQAHGQLDKVWVFPFAHLPSWKQEEKEPTSA